MCVDELQGAAAVTIRRENAVLLPLLLLLLQPLVVVAMDQGK